MCKRQNTRNFWNNRSVYKLQWFHFCFLYARYSSVCQEAHSIFFQIKRFAALFSLCSTFRAWCSLHHFYCELCLISTDGASWKSFHSFITCSFSFFSNFPTERRELIYCQWKTKFAIPSNYICKITRALSESNASGSRADIVLEIGSLQVESTLLFATCNGLVFSEHLNGCTIIHQNHLFCHLFPERFYCLLCCYSNSCRLCRFSAFAKMNHN